MEIKYEPYSVAYGADIEVFRNATLEIRRWFRCEYWLDDHMR